MSKRHSNAYNCRRGPVHGIHAGVGPAALTRPLDFQKVVWKVVPEVIPLSVSLAS